MKPEKHHPEPFPGSGDKWWNEHARPSEKATADWIREHCPLDEPVTQVGHDGLIVRAGTTLPEWQYRQKYPKRNKRYLKLGIYPRPRKD